MLTFIFAILYFGWNLVSGPPQVESPAQYHAANPCAVAIYSWIGQTQSWAHWFADVPSYVNSPPVIGAMGADASYWIYCAR